jgi:hypothetical protein
MNDETLINLQIQINDICLTLSEFTKEILSLKEQIDELKKEKKQKIN